MITVSKSTVIEAPVEAVWSFLRDFNAHHRWHPAVAKSDIEAGRKADQVAAVRAFSLNAGGALREQLLSLSDRDRSFTYCILDAPLPLFDYVATVRLKPVTDGDATFWEWRSSFDTSPGREAEMAALVGESIYEAGFDAVKRHFRQATEARDPSAPAPRRAVPTLLPQRSRAVVIDRYGGPEMLVSRDVPLSPPGPGEVTIRHTAIGLNFIDVYCRTGYFPLVGSGGVPGLEAAGVIEAKGEGVNGLMAGDRVGYACLPPGAYAERRTMAADLLVLLPDDVSDEQAAAGLLKGMTAEFLLHQIARVAEGDAVLVHAAAGGVGLLLCRWARALGCTVIGTVSSEAKARLARDHGCSYPILYRSEDLPRRVMEITNGEGCRVAFDAVGRDTIAASIACLGVQGHLVSYGQASGHIEGVDVAGLAAKSLTLTRPNFGHYTDTPAKVRSITDRLFAAHRQGHVRLDPRQSFPLAQAAEAHRALESRETMGATILVP